MENGSEDMMFQHVDNQDIMYQHSFTLWNLKGSNLVCKMKHDTPVVINNRRRFVRFDGKLPHKAKAVANVTRYSFILYKNYDCNISGGPLPILFTPQYMIRQGKFNASDQWYDNLSSAEK